MAYPEVPASLLRMASLEWNLTGGLIGVGQTAAGNSPVVRTDGGGLWAAVHTNLMLTGNQDNRLADTHRAFRALQVLANGGASPLIVPRPDIVQPWPVDGGGNQITDYGPIPFDDGTFFDDGTGFSQPVIDIITVGDASLRSTQLTLDIIYGSALRGGEAFSILHPTKNWRLYVSSTIAIDGNGHSVVSFLPPLREAVVDSTQVEFDLPRCLMRLPTMDSMHYRIDAPWISTPSMSLIEYGV